MRAHFLAEDSMRAGCPDDLRAKGWTVAVHNDYEQGGERFTFWLMTKKGSNIALKGEGKTDAEALDQIREQIRAPDNVSRLRHWANGWWKGVHDLAAAVGATIDEDGEDVEGAASRLGGLLEAVGRRDDPSTWEQYKAAEVCECEQPDLRAGRCFSCGGAWFPDGNDEEP